MCGGQATVIVHTCYVPLGYVFPHPPPLQQSWPHTRAQLPYCHLINLYFTHSFPSQNPSLVLPLLSSSPLLSLHLPRPPPPLVPVLSSRVFAAHFLPTCFVIIPMYHSRDVPFRHFMFSARTRGGHSNAPLARLLHPALNVSTAGTAAGISASFPAGCVRRSRGP